MYWNIINEAYCGNFSFYILITNILQLLVGIGAFIIAVKMYKIKKQERKEKAKQKEKRGNVNDDFNQSANPN